MGGAGHSSNSRFQLLGRGKSKKSKPLMCSLMKLIRQVESRRIRATLPNLTAVAAAGEWEVKEFGLRLGNVWNPRR